MEDGEMVWMGLGKNPNTSWIADERHACATMRTSLLRQVDVTTSETCQWHGFSRVDGGCTNPQVAPDEGRHVQDEPPTKRREKPTHRVHTNRYSRIGTSWCIRRSCREEKRTRSSCPSSWRYTTLPIFRHHGAFRRKSGGFSSSFRTDLVRCLEVTTRFREPPAECIRWRTGRRIIVGTTRRTGSADDRQDVRVDVG